MKSRFLALWASLSLLLLASSSSLTAGITGATTADGTYGLLDTITITINLEGPIRQGTVDRIELRLTGNDIYGNFIDDWVVASSSVPPLRGPQADTAAETGQSSVSYTIPNDGTLHNISSRYTLTPVLVQDGVDSGSGAETKFFINVETNLEATELTYKADTYEGGDIIDVTYQVWNITASGNNLSIRPLRYSSADSYRSRIFLTPEPDYDASEDFRLGYSTFYGDNGSFIPNGITNIRSLVVTNTPSVITSYGRNYQPQPDDGFLDIGEFITVRQEFMIPTNYSGTYFLGLATDAVDNLPEQSETDNIYVSDSTPRIRIISGPASNTVPASEVTDDNGDQIEVSNNYSDEPSISENGGLVAFQSFATNLTPDAGYAYNGLNQIFLRDADTYEIDLISQSIGGAVGNGTSINPQISANGRYVVFESNASNLVNSDTNNSSDIFVRDVELGSTIRLTMAPDGTQPNGSSFNPSISETGRFVAFESVATNLDPDSSAQPGPGTGRIQIYVIDRDVSNSGSFDIEGNVEIYTVSLNNGGQLADENVLSPVLSLDGNSLCFVTDSTNFPSANGYDQVYLRTLSAGQPTGNVTLVSRRLTSGAAGNGDSDEPALNGGVTEPHGLQIAFSSSASNLITGDTNGVSDVFVRDYSNPDQPVTRRISVSNNRKAFTTIQFINSSDVRGVLPNNNVSNGDYLILDDGINSPATFTFGSNVPLGANAAESRDNLVAAINTRSNLLIEAYASNSPATDYLSSRYGYSPGLSLLNEQPGTQGNQSVTVSTSILNVDYGSFVGGGIQADNELTPSVEQGVPTGSLQPTIDREGGLISYRSLAQNLSIDPDNAEWIRPLTNFYSNVFLFNRDVDGRGTLDADGNTLNSKISVNPFGYPTTGLLGVPSTGSTRLPSLSADGGSIAMATDGDNVGGLRFGATNVLPLDSNEHRDIYIFLRDINRDSGTGSDQTPIISVSSPSSGDTVIVGERQSLAALVVPVNASNNMRVEFYVNGISVGTDTSEPYVANWTPKEAGDYTIVARATEENVGSAVSTAVVVSAVQSTGAYVNITSPSDGNGFALGSSITIEVDSGVENSTSTIESVEILQNGNSLTTLTSAPYTVEFTPSSTGQYTITATATVNTDGETATITDSIAILVALSPPSVTVVSPLDGDTVSLGTTVTVAASASSSSQDVVQVEFMVNGDSIGVDTTYPFSADFVPSTTGGYTVQAFATDTNGVRVGDSVDITVADDSSTISITEPAVGTQFSILDTLPLSASVTSTKQVRSVRFYANGVSISTDSYSPYEGRYSASQPGNVVFTAQATLSDGTTITSAPVATQGISTPLATSANFINQAFLDFTGTTPSEATLSTLEENLESGAISQADVILDILNTSKGSGGVSIVGAYQTVLSRFPDPTEYQEALLDIDNTSPTEDTGGTIPISLGEPVTGDIDGSSDVDTYTFTVSSAQTIYAYAVSPIFMNITLKNSSGSVIASSSDGMYTINPVLSTSVSSSGTYILEVDGIGIGTYSLTVSGEDNTTTGVSGSFTLTTLLNNLFESDEYVFKFGPLPDVNESGNVGVENRISVFSELFNSKYGGNPTDTQEFQGQLRISTLGGVTPFTEVFITEVQLDNGTDLIEGMGPRRPYWRTVLLILALFNEQPTVETISEFEGMSLVDQINAMLSDERYIQRFPPVDSILFDGSIASDGWVNSSWMGYINVKPEPWYYHITLGWLYTAAVVSDNVWFYDPVLDWFYTNSETYPFMYSIQYGAWLYYLEDTSDPAWFYNTATGQWFSLFL